MFDADVSVIEFGERMMQRNSNLTRGLRKNEVWSCRFIWMICFSVFLPVAVLARLSGWRWRPWSASSSGYRSVIQEAQKISTTVTGTVFSV
jgi:hypothetical protein